MAAARKARPEHCGLVLDVSGSRAVAARRCTSLRQRNSEGAFCRRGPNNGHLWDRRSGYFESAKMVSSALRIELAGRPGRGGGVPGAGVGPGVDRCSLQGEEAVYGEAIRGVFRHLVQAGVSTAAICRELGISRQTAYNWKASGGEGSGGEGSASGQESGTYGARSRSGSLLDPYRDLIESRLREFPSLSVVRLFAEIREAGYCGGYDLVKRYAREVRPRPPKEPVVRFETAPGRQGQVDFAECRLPWGKRYALLVVLGYSRLLWFQFYPRQTMDVLIRGLEAAFVFFGGVPWELLCDQMKAVIIEDRRASAGELLRNPEFSRFGGHWRFKTRACGPYRAQTKDQASDCASEERWGGNRGRRRRWESLRPWCLAGGSSPGGW